MPDQFPIINGTIEQPTAPDAAIASLRLEHVLQRHRDVWIVVPEKPFLAVDAERVQAHLQGLEVFPVLSSCYLMQNSRPDEGASRIVSMLMGGGTDAGTSASARSLVEGKANPKARWLLGGNPLLAVGTSPYAALRTHYVYVDGTDIYQRQIGTLETVNTLSRPRSSLVDFDPLADLREALHREAFPCADVERTDVGRLSALLDAIFAENLAILSRVASHHRDEPADAEFDYHAPELTRYGRLVNDAGGSPRVEIAFGLLHYERALREFDQVKRASRESRKEATLAAGVYCIVSIAACLEAVSNKLFFLDKGRHPSVKDRGTPLEKLNESASAVAGAHGRNFVPLDSSDDRYQAMDQIRKLRNSFMHASERDEAVSPDTLLAEVFDEVSEMRCRVYLRQLRLTIGWVFDQLPGFQPPIVTSEKVTWMGDIEVP